MQKTKKKKTQRIKKGDIVIRTDDSPIAGYRAIVVRPSVFIKTKPFIYPEKPEDQKKPNKKKKRQARPQEISLMEIRFEGDPKETTFLYPKEAFRKLERR